MTYYGEPWVLPAVTVPVDVLITGNVQSFAHQTGLRGPYWISNQTGFVAYVNVGFDMSFSRTTDAGASWAETEIEAGTVRQIAIWFDQETPGDAGELVHIVWANAGAATDSLFYQTVDVSDGSQGTKRTIDATITVGAAGVTKIGITKTRNGNLIAALHTPTEIVTYRSVDAGVTWTTRATLHETIGQADLVLLFPANTADTADAAALYWDISADAISIKMYDDSADTWTETAILSSMVDDTSNINLDGAVRHSDGLILGTAHSNDDTPTNDIRTWTANPNSIASPTIDTTTADVSTDIPESAEVGMLIDQNTDDVYVSYLKGGTWAVSVDAFYKKSTDDMATWGSEQAYSVTTSDFRAIHAGRTVGSNGGRFQPLLYNIVTIELFVNVDNDVAL